MTRMTSLLRVRAACLALAASSAAASAACGSTMGQASGSDAGRSPPVNDDAGGSVTIVGPVDGGAYVATPDASPPVDTRPSPPAPWSPPFALGASGWKQSTTPICEPYYGSDRELGLWSDERGVFVLFGTACPLQELNPCGSTGSSIQFNDGSDRYCGPKTSQQASPQPESLPGRHWYSTTRRRASNSSRQHSANMSRSFARPR